MTDRRYRQFCAVAKALDVVGERWSLLVVRNLLVGSQSFSELSRDLPMITPTLLSRRLRELMAEGIVEKREGRRGRYALTAMGRGLEPVVFALGDFGERYGRGLEKGDAVNPRWAALSLRRRYRRKSGARGLVELRIEGESFTLRMKGRQLVVRAGVEGVADCVVSGALPAVYRAALGERSKARIEGDRAVLERLAEAFRRQT